MNRVRSTPTPKEIFSKRVAKYHLLKERQRKCKEVLEHVDPVQRKDKRRTRWDRELKEDNKPSPYDLPNHIRLFSTQWAQRKVAPMPFIMSDPHSICDVDHTFYKIIEGRPLRQHCDTKVYMSNIRDITLFRANAAYLIDQIIQIDTSYKFEMEEYNKINIFYIQCKNNFVTFAKQNYTEAKIIQEIAADKSAEVMKVIDGLESLCFEYVKLRNQVSSLIATYETLTRYKKFLNSLSPSWWREKHEESCAIGSRICAKFVEDVALISSDSVDLCKQSAYQLLELKPQIYFKKPRELIHIFESLNSVCLNFLLREPLSIKILQSVLNQRDYLKANMLSEYEMIEVFIDTYNSVVTFKEDKMVEYKAAFNKVLANDFERIYASYDSNKLFTCVQYVHTQIFATAEDPKDSIATVMGNLENLYVELTMGLDSLDQEIVKAATHQFFSDDIKKMNLAYRAKRLLRESDILSKALYTSFEPSRKKINKK